MVEEINNIEKIYEVKNWVFDLDDTLYPPNKTLNNEMGERISNYIMKVAHVDKERADFMKKDFYQRYGATVWGLMNEYEVDPVDFTEDIHKLDLSVLKKDPELRKAIELLPGKKYVFTNGAYQHATGVIKQVGLEGLFEGIFSIREAEYIPKPAQETFMKMFDYFDLIGEECLMFDDNQKNILGAKKAGMKTVWISSNVDNNKYCMSEEADFCDFQAFNCTEFINKIKHVL
ncbi:MAG: pyrimidine 5'-nucleotidase [Alphaproteobacteria bacterium]|nr:pyrimidine 5'-nucleotidase [Alphaproteobacteria bacterium]